MFEEIKNKKVLITGATGGIGESIAKIFAEHGADIGIHYNTNEEKAKSLLTEIQRKSIEAGLFRGNLLDSHVRKNLISQFVQKFGKIDVLINNAGAVYDYKDFSELDEISFDNTFALNVKAPFYLISSAFEHMKNKNYGRIINISTSNVNYGGSAKSLHYVSSKAALDSLTLGFAKEGAKFNILVNSIKCGVIDTSMRKKIEGYSEENFKKRIELIPLKRAGSPEDIARMALFLASKSGNFITGKTFEVSGGE